RLQHAIALDRPRHQSTVSPGRGGEPMTRIHRRAVLKGLFAGSAVTVGLPPLEAMMNATGTAWADGENFPTRFVLWTWGNGIIPHKWLPEGTGTGDDWALSPELA